MVKQRKEVDGEAMLDKGGQVKKNKKKEKGRYNKDIDQCVDGEFKKKKTKKEKKRKKVKEADAICAAQLDIGKDKESTNKKKKNKRKRDKENTSLDHKDLLEEDATIQMENNMGKANKGKKRVSFSGQLEVFPVPSDEQDKLVRGQRFSPEEDKIIQDAVYNYIEERGLGEEGLNMVMHCKSQPEVKGCWDHIAKALPYRPRASIYCRAHILFESGEKRKWSEEETELLTKLHAEHGNQWKLMADEFGRNRYHVKDTWRRVKLLNKSKGQWSQKEYQALFDLVNTDLRMKIIEDEEKKQKHGMLRDDIHWNAISDNLTTRTGPNCCMKWYGQLSSPMVDKKLWVDSDDYRLIDALFTLDASCIEDVDWDDLLGHRSGDLCRERWNQMVLHIGNHMSKSFSEQVEILTKRYCPDLIEVRVAWENKPFVD